jgi:hypothetical protein
MRDARKLMASLKENKRMGCQNPGEWIPLHISPDFSDT